MKRPSRGSLKIIESDDQQKLRTWAMLVDTFHRLQRVVSGVIAEHGMTLPQFDLLATLRYSDGVTQQTLAERLLVTKGNICGLLDRLEEAGLVERRPDAVDGRTNRVHLTAVGRRRLDSVMPHHDAQVLEMMRRLNAGQVKQLRESLISLAERE